MSALRVKVVPAAGRDDLGVGGGHQELGGGRGEVRVAVHDLDGGAGHVGRPVAAVGGLQLDVAGARVAEGVRLVVALVPAVEVRPLDPFDVPVAVLGGAVVADEVHGQVGEHPGVVGEVHPQGAAG